MTFLLSPKQCRRARRLNTFRIRRALIARDGWHCHYCQVYLVEPPHWKHIQSGTPIETKRQRTAARLMEQGARMMTIEHLVPVCMGGSRDLLNLVLACPNCNYAKKYLSYAEFKRR